MRINVSKIPEEGTDLQFEKDGAWFQERLTSGEDEVAAGTVSVSCTVRRMRETVYIAGAAAAEMEMSCGRCLERTRVPVTASFNYTFVPGPDRTQEEWELTAEDLDVACYEEDVIDLDDLIFEQILLQIPVKPLCSETCKGLCPQCGVNLNAASCQCRTDRLDERFAALKTFKVRS